MKMHWLYSGSRTARALVLFSVLVAAYFLVFIRLMELSDTALFGGDAWEYQSMGVNLAMGHGIQRFGALEPFETYKFEEFDEPPSYYGLFFDLAGEVDVVRTPGYPLFLGLVYSVFGISPRVAKIIQLMMLVIVAASLPMLGHRFWGRQGLVGGILAGGFYLMTNHKLADWILTESLMTFSVFLVLLALIEYHGWEDRPHAILLGISFGAALLVKGSLVFIPFLACGAILVDILRHRNPVRARNLLRIVISAGFLILPWSIYASVSSGEFIILSQQEDKQLLDDNNELCVDGIWHPEWVDDENAFYNNDGIDPSRGFVKVINFYWHHPVLLPVCMYNKFIKGFGPLPFFWIFLGLMLFKWGTRFAASRLKWNPPRWYLNQPEFKVPMPFWVVIGNFLLVTLIFHGESYIVPSRLVAPVDFVFALLGCVGVVRLFSGVFRRTN